MKRRNFFASSFAAMALATTAFASDADKVTFHFYGAEDCPPCMAFKRNHLEDVRAEGAELGFAVEDNVIAKTRDVPNPGVYGERDAILRLAAPQLEVVYPPIFFISKGGEIVSVHAHDWRTALQEARKLGQQS